jgi:pyrroloquinoline-quinone synthase
MNKDLLTAEELKSKLLAVGAEKYHHKHPFHLLMHEGKLTRGQLQAWALNRYYYQSRIPIKDAIILSKSEDPKFRRDWIKRITDHDGKPGDAASENGGIEKWIKLGEATGLTRGEVESCEHVLPGVRYSVDAYVQFVSKKPLLEAVASSLTELFSASLITLRIGYLKNLYPWLKGGLDYFEGRLTQAPEDSGFALDYVTRHAQTRDDQEKVIAALSTKCDILWTQLDSIHHAYVDPAVPPPGARKYTESAV